MSLIAGLPGQRTVSVDVTFLVRQALAAQAGDGGEVAASVPEAAGQARETRPARATG
ncbi:hypothetical protein [Microbacterium ulmi]|uniref:Uncharacterized protein n=1 Tax=Microbacterium ulmi TaxID=179095 RepID=A0A7Y2M042_9MICO|nr:hypothetical protein [Microbacterium ulmi]NII69393.1 hypothetical protein [Microbacterium ulmi]NNH03995.1 hypothetical protein [Microbacterium ulmi]